MASPVVNISSAGWLAELKLGFAHDGARTVLAQRTHRGPLQVQRAFYPEPHGACQVYLLHPPGGVVGGDELSIDVNLAERAQALVTTPAAGKFYRSSGLTACQRQHLKLAPHAALEWFPQENILFDGARVTLQTHVELSADSSFMGWEIICLGRPASGERFATGEVRTGFEIWRDKTPLWVERSFFAGGAALLSAPWGLGGQAVTGSFVCVAPPPAAVDAVRAATQEFADDERFGVTRLGEALVCRYLGNSAPRARQLFQRAWEVLRPLMYGRAACPPRIWHT